MSVRTHPTDPSNVTETAPLLTTKLRSGGSFTPRTDARAQQTGEEFILSERFVSGSVPFLISRRKIDFKTGGSLINCLNAVGLLSYNTNNYCRSCHQILLLYMCQKHTQRLIVQHIFTAYSPL